MPVWKPASKTPRSELCRLQATCWQATCCKTPALRGIAPPRSLDFAAVANIAKVVHFLVTPKTQNQGLSLADHLPSANDFGVRSSAIYGCGYNSCGCNLRLSEVRSGSFEVDWGRFGDQRAPNRPQIGSHIVVATSIDRRYPGGPGALFKRPL